MFKISGVVKVVKETQVISDKFRKREFVLTDASGMYPQDILFQLTQDKCDLGDTIKEQDQIEVSFNLRGREWTSPQGEVKYFNTLEAWRIESQGGGMTNTPAAEPMSVDNTSNDEEGDLPF